jgi:tetratricopeptide (TPR) repeat protein
MRAAALTAALLLSCACASMNSRRAVNYLRRGEQEERAGRLERAVALYRRAEAADPDNPEARSALAAALAKIHPEALPPAEPPPAEPPKTSAINPLAVLDRLKKADAPDPSNGEAFYTMGMEFKESGKDREAAVLLQRFVAQEKSSPSPRHDLLKKAEDALFEMNASLPQ